MALSMSAESTHQPLKTPPPKRKQPWHQSRRARMAGIVVMVLAAAGTLTWYFAFYPYVSTDDARVAATLIRIAPESVGGRVIKLNVKEGDRVKKGEVLAEIDHRIADAHFKRAHAKAEQTAHELKRVRELVNQRGLAPRELDLALANAEGAEADLQLAQVNLENTTLKSPIDGVVVQKTTEEGNIVEPGQTILTVVDTDHAWVNANIEETAVAAVKAGQSVRIKIDEGGSLEGRVAEVRSSVAAQFALIPSDNGAGNFTKVVQRVPIKIELEPHPGRDLRVGQSVVIKVRVH